MDNKILQSTNPHEINFPEISILKIEDDFNEKIKVLVGEKLKKTIEDVREEIELEYYANYSDNLRHFLDSLVLDKAKALVVGLLDGDKDCIRTFLEFGHSREKVLASVIDYAAKIEIEDLRQEIKRLINYQ
jgi:hypothetical protein